ncbi:MAG: M28 family metallopeptidase [Candidatus Aminicenantes bacterium]|nr:MAG: M28 family metallopeptidase [Candidatus Aminicenantes bacterium]
MKLLSTMLSLSRIFLRRLPYLLLFLTFTSHTSSLSFQDSPVTPKKNYPSSFKSFVDEAISPERIETYLKYFTAEPHVASSPRNNELANFILKEWKAIGLDDVHLAQYDVLLSFPEEINVELVSPHKYKLIIKEQSYKEDPFTLNPEVGIPYNAYSRSGDITASLIYANGGNPEDYDLLERKGIKLEGKIALVRYSVPYSYRGFKALTAEKRGLRAILIYSDPKEDGFARGPVFPHGPWGPLSHIQRGGIPYDFIYPGDPLTPGWASKPGSKRIPREKAITLPKIISVPLSAQNALPLLKAMGGEEAPEEWKGALPVTYRLGDSQAQVHIKVNMKNPINRIINVIGCIKGARNEKEIILAGNHRDAWVYGGYDPSSGTACLMELVRAMAEAKKAGFKPERTICFASWDAEEFTLTGSTEWGEDNRDWLKKNLIAFLNVDSAASGKNFSVQAVPCLSPLIIQALKEIKDSVSKDTIYDAWKSGSTEKGTIAVASGGGRVNPIGSGTDHTVFLNHIGAPALDMTFSGDYGVYHSMYDDYYWMANFGDPGMRYTATLAKIWAHMIIELASKPILPLDYEIYAKEFFNYLEEWAKSHDPTKEKSKKLFTLIEEMKKHASMLNQYIFHPEIWEKIDDEEKTQKVNRILIGIERDFTDPQGIPRRDWFKHLVFGARYTYAVLLLPALTEAAEAGDEEGVSQALQRLEEATKKVILKLKKAAIVLGTQ